MGSKSSRRQQNAMHFPVRLDLHRNTPIPERDRAIAATANGAPWDTYLAVWMMTPNHAARMLLACPRARLDGRWPIRMTVGVQRPLLARMRRELAALVGEDGYFVEEAGLVIEGFDARFVFCRNAYDAVRVVRACPWMPLVAEECG